MFRSLLVVPSSSLRALLLTLLLLAGTNAYDYECQYFQGDLETTDATQRVHLCELNGFRYRLEAHLLEGIPAEDLVSGQTTLLLSNMFASDTSYMFEIMEGGDYPSVVTSNNVIAQLQTGQITGTRSVLIVRVISNDGLSPSVSQESLRENMFGSNIVSFASQYRRCSNGALNFVPASAEGANGGVIDLRININARGAPFDETFDAALAGAFMEDIGSANPYQHILFCLPRNMATNFIAFAVLNSRYSFYADPWCNRLSATMHEIGHNLNLEHSGLAGDSEYGDETGMMGIGYSRTRGPQKCFNGAKFWAFNWFPSQRVDVDPRDGPFTGNLVAFVDAADTNMNMVIRVGDLYLVFNRAKEYNVGVDERRDFVTIVQSDTPFTTSWLVGSLNPFRTTFTKGTVLRGNPASVTIEWCSNTLGSQADSVKLSIRLSNQPSTCNVAATSPTPAPFFLANEENDGCSGVADGCNDSDDCCDNLRCVKGQTGLICINTNTVRREMMGYRESRGGAGGRRSLREGRPLGAV